MANDIDVDGDSLTAILVSQPAIGYLWWASSGDGRLHYEAPPDWYGTDSFTYKVNDGIADSNVATVTIIVSEDCTREPLVANDDTATTDEDTPVTINVLANDTNTPYYPMVGGPVTQPADGAVVNNYDGTILYTPDADYCGTDSFSYKVRDGTYWGHDSAIVQVSIKCVNDPPVVTVAQPVVTADEGQAATNSGVVSDVDGDTVTLKASVGTVINHGDGTWSWTFETSDGPWSQTVTISADDGQGGIGQTTFELTVNNVPPSVGPINAPTEPVVIGTVVNASAPFSDPGRMDRHTAVWVWGDGTSTPGTLTQGAGSGSVRDHHTYERSGRFTIRLTVTDDDGGKGRARHTLIVQSPSQAIESVGDELEHLDLPQGLENALTSKLDNALKYLSRGQDNDAVGKLNAFINSVQAQRGKKISAAEADALIQTAQEIIDAIRAGLL
jgi:hypothetical protein